MSPEKKVDSFFYCTKGSPERRRAVSLFGNKQGVLRPYSDKTSLSVICSLVSQPLSILLDATDPLAVVIGDWVREALELWVDAVLLDVLEKVFLFLYYTCCGQFRGPFESSKSVLQSEKGAVNLRLQSVLDIGSWSC
jgi:hypothetical protein